MSWQVPLSTSICSFAYRWCRWRVMAVAQMTYRDHMSVMTLSDERIYCPAEAVSEIVRVTNVCCDGEIVTARNWNSVVIECLTLTLVLMVWKQNCWKSRKQQVVTTSWLSLNQSTIHHFHERRQIIIQTNTNVDYSSTNSTQPHSTQFNTIQYQLNIHGMASTKIYISNIWSQISFLRSLKSSSYSG